MKHATYTPEPWGLDCPVFRALFPDAYRLGVPDELPRRLRWADHQSVRRVDGKTAYVCYPYALGPDAVADLAAVAAAGLDVTIDADSVYNPGYTIRVTISEACDE